MRKLATLEVIKSINPHTNADNLELAMVRGWQIVVKKGEFQAGDFCVYCEIDSVLPDRKEFEFLRKSKFRIKTIRLRGELSQGICFPIHILQGLLPEYGAVKIGDDVTELLGVTLYQPPIPMELAGDVEGKFPSFIPKTDEERIQNCAFVLEKYRDLEWVATEKANGSSVTYFVKDGVFGACSRNWWMKETPGNLHWKLARQLELPERMARYEKNFALQGELLGHKIQGNPYKLTMHEVRFFSLYWIDEQRYGDYQELLGLCRAMSLDRVPTIHYGDILPATVEEALRTAEGYSDIGPTEREGLVYRPLKEVTDPALGRLSFKAISNKFLLGRKD
jgi:RNA ligase (TIGR02306 family)